MIWRCLSTQVLEWGGGGVLEALSIAVLAALKVIRYHQSLLCALYNNSSLLSFPRIPRLIISGEGEEMEFEVSDNPHDVVNLDVREGPVIVTLSQVCMIKSHDY